MFSFNKSWRLLSRLILIDLLFVLAGCGLAKQPNYQHDVEVAPGQWLTLKEERGKCWFMCEWKGKQVMWDGKRNRHDEEELPVTLREHEGNLYLIVLNRENMEALKLIYFELDKSGAWFRKISNRDFPKRIATQNMLLSPQTRMVGVYDKWIDSWEVIRSLDVESPYFQKSYTAAIWIELETGVVYAEQGKIADDERRRILREYKVKYQPIPLPTLVKESPVK